jgi:hypothetical protein
VNGIILKMWCEVKKAFSDEINFEKLKKVVKKELEFGPL